MAVRPVTIGPGTTLDEAARTLTKDNLEQVPVTDADGKVLGLLTIDAIIMASIKSVAKGSSADFCSCFDTLCGMTAADFAARQQENTPSDFSCIGPEASLAEVARLLLNGKNRVLLVTDNATRLLGVISATDVVRRLNTGK
ncbi:MAG: CBS domain-containing protein [Deltaproteobacteria bacterium]|nr:CBS domain-containing protein [Deltaproteobacteria bacterium]